jgi:hypothetical protein
VGQESPGAAAANDVEDGVEDLAQGMYSGPSGSFRDRDIRLYVGPFGIGQVGLVCSSHAR